MAIDSKAKRFSILNMMGAPFHYTLPVADSSFDQADRQHFLHLYSGILIGAAVATKVGSVFWLLPAHVGDWILACLPRTYTLPEQSKSWGVEKKRRG